MADATKQKTSQVTIETVDQSSFRELVKKEARLATDDANAGLQSAVTFLAAEALKNTALISDDSTKTIQALIAAIDQKLTAQVNEVIHHDEYQKLESAWRGLHYLVNNTKSDDKLKIRYMSVSKEELSKSLKKFKGVRWDQSPLFKTIYTQEYGQLGGEPYGCLIGDYYFDHTPSDVELLGEIAKTAAAAHAPFIAAAAPSLMQMKSWTQLPDPDELTGIFKGGEYAQWKSLRESPNSKYVGLTAPRFLARLPYGAKTARVEEFAFEEDTTGADHDKYCWSNAAYAMGVNINRAFKKYGWCAKIRGYESGGLVEDLPTHTFSTDDGGVDTKCPTEVAISNQRAPELAKNGIIALVHEKNRDRAAFIEAGSLHQPEVFRDPDATASAKLGARLPYMFATCRFAHFLNSMVTRKIGSAKEVHEVKAWLESWISDYVLQAPDLASEDDKARYPLSSAEVEVTADPEDPGVYKAKFW